MVSSTFVPAFQSEFKNYFIGESNIEAGDEYTLKGSESIDLQLLWLDNTNRNFSAISQSEDKESAIGVRMIEDEETGDPLLDLYLIDYRATDFFTDFEEFYMYNDEKPMATMSGTYFNATFKQVE